MDDLEYGPEPTSVDLVKPVFLAMLMFIIIKLGVVGISVYQLDTSAVDVDVARASVIVESLSSRAPSVIVAKMEQAGFADVTYIADGSEAAGKQSLPVVTAQGLRRGTISFSPQQPGSDVFASTIGYKAPVTFGAFGVVAFLLLRLGKQTRDIDQRRIKAREAALTDGLSKLPNRRAFDAALQKAIDCTATDCSAIALYFIDIDNFKGINDSFGHAVGDQIIQAVAERLRGALGPDDTAARLSGDEFAIIRSAPGTGGSTIAFGHALVALFALPVTTDGGDIEVTVSIGVVQSDKAQNGDASDLRRRADNALYVAKAKGRNCAVLAETAMRITPEQRPAYTPLERRSLRAS